MKSVCMLAMAVFFFRRSTGRGRRERPGSGRSQARAHQHVPHHGKFTQLVDFYEHILGIAPRKSNGVYAEFPTGAGVLAIFTAGEQERYIPGSALPASNHSAILEFKVANVDEEFIRLHKFVKRWVKPPTNQPWGTRSFYFRDPDENLIDFYAAVKGQ